MTTNDRNPSVYGTLSSTRTLKPLRDLCVQKIGIQTGPFGSQLHNSDYVSIGVPIITVEHLGENIIDGKDAPLVSTEDAARLARYTLETGDIVFSRVGSVDRRSIVSTSQRGWLFSGRLLRVRPNHELVNSTFLSYFFGLESFKSYIRSIAVGATMPSLNTELLSTVPVIVPAMEEQKVIAAVLASLDDKIRLNTELSQTLEAIAQTIFKSWFIDFDPVHAKSRGEKPEGMSDEIAALFPDSFEESELGLIPKGWVVKPASDLYDVAIGRTPPRKEPEWFCEGNSGVQWVSIRDMGTYGVFSTRTSECLTSEAVVKHRVPIVPENTVLMSFKLTVGKLCITDTDLVTNEAIAHFKRNTSSPSTEYTYLWLGNFEMGSLDSTSSIGTATNSGGVRKIPFLVPVDSVMNSFNVFVESIFTQLKLLSKEIQTLTEIRDSLLPRLISGEIEIPSEMLAS